MTDQFRSQLLGLALFLFCLLPRAILPTGQDELDLLGKIKDTIRISINPLKTK